MDLTFITFYCYLGFIYVVNASCLSPISNLIMVDEGLRISKEANILPVSFFYFHFFWQKRADFSAREEKNHLDC